MKHSTHLWFGLLLGVVGSLPCGAPAAAQSALSPTIVTKAKAYKDVDDKYRLALCGGRQAERDQSKGIRDYLQNDLQQLIANEVTASPLVQKALDAAAAAGEAADKAAAAPGATDQEKTAAAARFAQAKKELHDVAARERAWVESELGKDYGVTFGAPEACSSKPTLAASGKPTLAAREPEQPAKPHTRTVRQPHAATQKTAASAPAAPAAAAASPAFSPSISIGSGGTSIGFGGGSISFGR
jgi:hypothetical protein